MTNEEKQLLLKDICARLPYSILGLHRGEDLQLDVICDSGSYMVLGYNAWFNFDTVPFKPYLRRMSSMTEKEVKEFHHMASMERDYLGDGNFYTHYRMIDWLNAHHFDYRGLIPMGLALEAKEGMYK